VRWGGEEFLVLVRAMPGTEAEALAQRLLCALADTPVLHEGRPVPVSASIGHGVFPLRCDVAPDGGEAALAVDWERAIAFVDSAMYLAKAHGRNGACGIRRVAAADASALEEMSRALEAAWRDGQVELHLVHGPCLQEAAQ